jgi:geranylgeranyl diphosphate synthase type I
MTTPSATPAPSAAALGALLDAAMIEALGVLDGPASLLPGMARYHLGFADERLQAMTPTDAIRGKRMRPMIAMLAAAAAGGDPGRAAPLAAGIELLHNFTLMHDDIQDHSPTRRHRPTLWTLWGVGQAINVGDAVFAASQLALFQSIARGCSPELTLRLSQAFQGMTIEIVQGQVLDLGFEGRDDVTVDAYVEMIGLKTSAIVRYAAWAGALVGGADDARAARFGAFGWALGLGFQVRDDVLGIWGAADVTGKAAADDIRRRKQSLPILLLRERATAAERQRLDALYAQPQIDEAGVAEVLALLDRHAVRDAVEARVAQYHDDARAALDAAAVAGANPARDALAELVENLAMRQH